MSIPYYSIHTGLGIDAAITDAALLRLSLDLLIEPTSLTGGGAGALDAVTTVSKAAGSRALVITGDLVTLYVLKAGTDAESSPDIIRPDDYAGTTNEKVWQRQGLLATKLGLGTTTFPTMTGPCLALGDVTAAPTVEPGSGGVLFSDGGVLKWLSSSGEITTIAE